MLVYELNGKLRLCVDGKKIPKPKPELRITPKKNPRRWRRNKE